MIGGTIGIVALVITAACMGARCVDARTKRHFPPAKARAKEEEVKVPSSPSSTEDLEAGFLGGTSRQVCPLVPFGSTSGHLAVIDGLKKGELEGICTVETNCGLRSVEVWSTDHGAGRPES